MGLAMAAPGLRVMPLRPDATGAPLAQVLEALERAKIQYEVVPFPRRGPQP